MRAAYRSALFAIAVLAATIIAVVSPTTAAAEPTTGSGSAVTRVVDVRTLTTVAHATTVRPAATARPLSPAPAQPTTGTRPPAKQPTATAGGPNSAAGLAAPAVAPGVVTSFDGITEATGCGSCQPANVNAAVGVAEIMEMANLRFLVTSKTGVPVCDLDLTTFLGGADTVSDPRVVYDNVNHRYLFAASVVAANSQATPAMWVASTVDDEACGIWELARITFSGSAFPLGTTLSYPIVGQDRNALLISTDNLTPGGENFTAFAVPKAPLSNGGSFSFSAFGTVSRTAPVSNAGIPMIATTFSYFLGSVPNGGYRLYRMANSGTTSATLTLLASLSAPFSAPSRRINQPGTAVTLDPLDGRIASSPINDGSFIWFAHGISLSGFPTVRYGAISLSTGSVTVAFAYHSNTSDDFNPSVAVANAPGGGNYVFVNWAYTDAPSGVPASVTVDSVNPHGGVPDLIGTGNVIVNGSRTTIETTFGRYSSVAIDPTVTAGSCAVAAQQYFTTNGTWRTRIARVGHC